MGNIWMFKVTRLALLHSFFSLVFIYFRPFSLVVFAELMHIACKFFVIVYICTSFSLGFIVGRGRLAEEHCDRRRFQMLCECYKEGTGYSLEHSQLMFYEKLLSQPSLFLVVYLVPHKLAKWASCYSVFAIWDLFLGPHSFVASFLQEHIQLGWFSEQLLVLFWCFFNKILRIIKNKIKNLINALS